MTNYALHPKQPLANRGKSTPEAKAF
jgi:hypothetical protein